MENRGISDGTSIWIWTRGAPADLDRSRRQSPTPVPRRKPSESFREMRSQRDPPAPTPARHVPAGSVSSDESPSAAQLDQPENIRGIARFQPSAGLSSVGLWVCAFPASSLHKQATC